MAIPSYVGGNTNFFGTGSTVYLFKNGTVFETYTLILQGDVNGDSVVDVLDSMLISRAQRNSDILKDSFFLAADFDNDGVISEEDYNNAELIGINS